jgi:HEAT repeat protein
MERTILVAATLLALTAPAAGQSAARSDGGAAGRIPFRARCDEASKELNADWQRWARENMRVKADGVDFSRLQKLAATEPATVERMLRLGLALCDRTAAEAITVVKPRGLLPELRDLLDPANVRDGMVRAGKFAAFRVDVVRAANAVDPSTDFVPYLLPMMSERDRDARMSAVIAARRFRKEGVSKALLDTVRRDSDSMVRFSAAQSLLELGDVYPRAVADHRRLAEALTGPMTGSPTSQDFDRYALAARMLEKLMAERTAGKCSEPVRPGMIHADVQQVGERVVAVAIDAAESSCVRDFALVVFVEAATGFGRWLVSGVESTRDPTNIELSTPAGDIRVEYSRRAGTARVRGVEIAKGHNTIVLVVGSDGRATSKWSGRLDTRIARGDDVARVLFQQSPALRKAVQP